MGGSTVIYGISVQEMLATDSGMVPNISSEIFNALNHSFRLLSTAGNRCMDTLLYLLLPHAHK